MLVVRGDLLKRYPNTIIYAQRAKWSTDPARTEPASPHDETGSTTSANPRPRPDIRFPLFKARGRARLHFIGFDLIPLRVRGVRRLDETAEARGEHPGRRARLVLRPPGSRGRAALRARRDELPCRSQAEASGTICPGRISAAVDRRFRSRRSPPRFPVAGTRTPPVRDWRANAADVASILYQKPVLVAVHGREMIKDLPPSGSPWTD